MDSKHSRFIPVEAYNKKPDREVRSVAIRLMGEGISTGQLYADGVYIGEVGSYEVPEIHVETLGPGFKSRAIVGGSWKGSVCMDPPEGPELVDLPIVGQGFGTSMAAVIKLMQRSKAEVSAAAIQLSQALLIQDRHITLLHMGVSEATVKQLEASARITQEPVAALDEYIRILQNALAGTTQALNSSFKLDDILTTNAKMIDTSRAARRTSDYGRHGGEKGEVRPWDKRKPY